VVGFLGGPAAPSSLCEENRSPNIALLFRSLIVKSGRAKSCSLSLSLFGREGLANRQSIMTGCGEREANALCGEGVAACERGKKEKRKKKDTAKPEGESNEEVGRTKQAGREAEGVSG
jgi:hypothetical protein